MTRITPENPGEADTLLTGGQYRTPERLEGLQMFRTDHMDYIVTAAIAIALLLTVLK